MQLAPSNCTVLCRFIDVLRGQKLHLWRTESGESSFPSLISSICACGSDKMQADGATTSPSWIAAGLSSGMCRLLDIRSGNVISTWRAHDGYVTKVIDIVKHEIHFKFFLNLSFIYLVIPAVSCTGGAFARL